MPEVQRFYRRSRRFSSEIGPDIPFVPCFAVIVCPGTLILVIRAILRDPITTAHDVTHFVAFPTRAGESMDLT
jgi:hypothetical protein